MTNVAAGFCYFSWVHCYRCKNAPHVELLAAATEQMKITELRMHKLIVSQQQQAASQSDASMAAERRAGLVFNHLMGACSLCHGSARTTGTDYWHKVGLDEAAMSSSICMSDVHFAVYAGAAPTMRSPITTHVLDTSMGRPAPGMLLQSCSCQRTTSVAHVAAQGASSMASIFCS